MSRYIDADALKEKIDSMWNGRPLSFLGARILVTIDEAPSIDIVRCRECKHRPIKEDKDGESYGFNIVAPVNGDDLCPCLVDDGWFSWLPGDDFYCGYGERIVQ